MIEVMNIIPEISDEKLSILMSQIRPVIKDEDGYLFYIKPVDPRGVSYTWSYELTDMAGDLRYLTEIKTYHSFGYRGFFKPSIAEVLAQIPEFLIPETVAFEIVNRPKHADDLNRESFITSYCYAHVADTRLYTNSELERSRFERYYSNYVR